MACIDADGELVSDIAAFPLLHIFGGAAVVVAHVALFELVAADRVVEEIGEVREQPQVIAHRVRVHEQASCAERRVIARRRGIARGVAAEIRIDLVERIDAPLCHGALRNLVGGIPAAVVRGDVELQSALVVAAAMAQQQRRLAFVLRLFPRAVVDAEIDRTEPAAAGAFARRGEQAAAVAVFTAA